MGEVDASYVDDKVLEVGEKWRDVRRGGWM